MNQPYPAPARFSRSIDLRKLERETRGYFHAGLLISIALYLGAVVFITVPKQPETRTPQTEPRRTMLTGIISIPVRDRVSSYTVRKPAGRSSRTLVPQGLRRGRTLPAETGWSGRGIPALRDEIEAVSPDAFDSRGVERIPDPDAVFPRIFTGTLPVERRGEKDAPLRDELLRPEDYIWSKQGVRTGLIEYNPDNKFALQGIVPLPVLLLTGGAELSPGMDRLKEGIENYTDLKIGRVRRFYLAQNTPLDYPFLFIAGTLVPEDLSGEIRRLHEYIQGGGFVFFEVDNSLGEKSMRKFISLVFGRGCRLRPLPDNHPVYTCYFEYPDGKPGSAESMILEETGDGVSVAGLYGAEMNGRLVAVFSERKYHLRWSGEDFGGGAMRMTINLLVYALRQDGGFAVRKQDAKLEPGAQALRLMAGKMLPGNGM